MKMSTTFRNTLAASGLDAALALLNSGALEVRTGSAPANTSDADSGTLLATATFGSTAFANQANGSASANAVGSDSSIDATGTAAHWRAKASGGTVHLQGTVGTSGTDWVLDSVSLVAGGVLNCTGFTVTISLG